MSFDGAALVCMGMDTEPNRSADQPVKLFDPERLIEAIHGFSPEFKNACYHFKHPPNTNDSRPPVSMPERRPDIEPPAA